MEIIPWGGNQISFKAQQVKSTRSGVKARVLRASPVASSESRSANNQSNHHLHVERGHDVGQIRIHTDPEGGAVSVLPDRGAQWTNQVSWRMITATWGGCFLRLGRWMAYLDLSNGNQRAFLTRTYPTMKKHNPQTPIMLREAAGTQPRIYARYGQSTLKTRRM